MTHKPIKKVDGKIKYSERHKVYQYLLSYFYLYS